MNDNTHNPLRRNVFIALSIAGLFTIGGCASSSLPEQHSYLLRTTTASASADSRQAQARVNIGQVSVPAYLQRDELLVLVSPREVRAARHHSWAEPLQQSIGRYLRDRLEEQLSADSATVERPLRVDVHIDELLGTLDGDITLKARYRINATPQNSDVTVHRVESRFAQQNDGYSGLVAGYETALDHLAANIAATAEAAD